jgi:hypothetical protein
MFIRRTSWVFLCQLKRKTWGFFYINWNKIFGTSLYSSGFRWKIKMIFFGISKRQKTQFFDMLTIALLLRNFLTLQVLFLTYCWIVNKVHIGDTKENREYNSVWRTTYLKLHPTDNAVSRCGLDQFATGR